MNSQESSSELPAKDDSKIRAYDIAFRERFPETLEPGEIYVLAADHNDPAARQRSLHVLEHGVAGLPQGAGPIQRIVVPLDPTLDDLLAATFCSRLLGGEPLPVGAKVLAEYAESARAGLNLSDLPPDSTIEGIFMAIRNVSGEDLGKPPTANRFVADWWRVSDRLMQAADSGVDPRKTKLFDDVAFADQRKYLAGDHKVFLEDVAAGEVWKVTLPGRAATSRALVLRHPISLIFKYFARSDTFAPGGKAFDLMAVQWGPSEWVFSTDPVRRGISLLSLHDKLQAAEVAKDPARAASNPWFDGASFQHTLIASPKGSSLLSDKEIERIVRGWCKARRQPRLSRNQLVAIAAGLLLLCAAGWWVRPTPAPVTLVRLTPPVELVPRSGGTDRALMITLKYDGPVTASSSAPLNDATAIGEILRTTYGFHLIEAFNVDGDGLKHALHEVDKIEYQPGDQLLVYLAGHLDADGQPVGVSQVENILDGSKCRHVLLIQDGCDDRGTALSAGHNDSTGTDDRAKDDVAQMGDPAKRLAFIDGQQATLTRRELRSFGKPYATGGIYHTPLAAEVINVLQTSGGPMRIVTLEQLSKALALQFPDRETVSPVSPFGTSKQVGSNFLFVDARPVPAALSADDAPSGP